MNKRLTMVIHSCDKFSDLWEPHINLLNKNWGDRRIETLLVTDKETERCFDGVRVISAGEGFELSKRIKAMLPYIKTEYILVTLDDYFPIYPISNKAIENLVDAMDKEKLDYIRLFKRPDSKKLINGYDSLYEIDLNGKKDTHYQINMYVGIWRKSFVEKTVEKELNAWDYELSLTQIARRDNLKCAMSKGREFEILDVVRKGKLLHKAAKYLKKHNLYSGTREVISYGEEFKIAFLTFVKDHTPQAFVDFCKKILNKFGFKFYSDRVK